MKKLICLLLLFTSFIVYNSYKTNAASPEDIVNVDYQVSREFRAVWISPLVGDIPKYSSKSQYQQAITNVLDTMEKNNLNVMLYHIRIYNDALYSSKANNWSSYYSTNPDWEALPWIIEECHKRGIEFHAWMNPYRVSSSVNSSLSTIASKFPRENPASNPDNLLKGKTFVILNPGIIDVRSFLLRTCQEVYEKYDVDAIHFDDYFYVEDVDDDDTYREFGTNQGIEQFRRDSIDSFIRLLHRDITEYNKKNNKSIELGISPTPAWNNGDGIVTYDENGKATSTGSKGISQGHYGDYLYCDTLKWVNEGWIDYIVPQCYIGMSNGNPLFAGVVDWWSKVCKYSKTKLYIGLGLYRAGGDDWANDNELLKEFDYMAKYDNIQGYAIFCYNDLKSGGSAQTNLNNARKYFDNTVLSTVISNYEYQNKENLTNYGIFYNEYTARINFSKVIGAKYYVLLKEVNGVISLLDIFNDNTYIDNNSINNSTTKTNYYLAPVYRDNTIGEYIKLSFNDKYNIAKFYDFNDELFYEYYYKNNEKINFPEPNPVEGYDFLTWRKDGDSYYSEYQKKTFSVKYYLNEELYFEEQVEYGKSGTLTNITLEGGVFSGWDKKVTNVTEDLIVKGTFTKNKYYIYLYDGDNLIEKLTVYYHDEVILDKTLEKEGYDFLGFSYMGSIMDKVIVEKSINMFAKYKIKTFTITYDLDGGVNNDNPQTFNYNDKVILSDPVKEGYIFTGWYEDDILVESITNKDYVLKAHYQKDPNVFYITYNLNGGNIKGESNISYRNSIVLEIPTRDGYVFLGWYDGDTLVTEASGKDYILEARWQIIPKEYQIVLDPKGGTLETDTIIKYSGTYTLINPKKEGFIFLGWFKDDKLVTSVTNENVTLLAKWEKIINEYIITLNTDGGKINIDSVISFKEDEEIILPIPIKEGFIFLGWYSLDTKVEKIENKDYSLIAKWEESITEYQISFELNGGSMSESSTFKFKDATDVTLPIPTKEGYTFIGWENNGTIITKIENQNYELQAKWEEKQGCMNSLTSLISSLSLLALLLIRKRRL